MVIYHSMGTKFLVLIRMMIPEYWREISSLNSDKEPCVIMAFYNGTEYEVVETLAQDFGDFILQLV